MRKILLCLLCAMVVISGEAQLIQKGEKYLYGTVVNSFTHQVVWQSKVTLLRTDSTVVDSFTMDPSRGVDFGEGTHSWLLKSEGDGKYILRFEHPDYLLFYKNVTVKFYRRELYYSVGATLLRKRPREQKLGEAVVKATRVKFYYKKDTLVYNADAFQLQEGSMLDALIRQLPGAELRDDGRIYVNGRYVESLILNGKDFFKGNNSVLLDNLPAYMVQNVKVYDKTDRQSEFIGHSTGQKSYVMDVGLKRQYSIGWIGNTETGVGTEDRYLARLFALRFTPQSRLTLYGTMNNLNDTRKPGQDGEWTPADLTGGRAAAKIAGLDYNVSDKRRRYELNGNAELKHGDDDTQSRTTTETFLNGGNTFGRAVSSLRNRYTSFSTNHNLNFKWKRLMLDVLPRLSYQHYSTHSFAQSGTFNNDGIPIDSLLSGQYPRLSTLNTQLSTLNGKSSSFSSTIGIDGVWRKAHTSDAILFHTNASYSDSRSDQARRLLVDYPQLGAAGANRNYATHERSANNYSYSGSLGYSYGMSAFMRLTPSYAYTQSYTSGRRGVEPMGTFGDSLHSQLSILNSFNSCLLDRQHTFSLEWHWELDNIVERIKGSQWMFTVELPLTFKASRLRYNRATIDTSFTRHFTLFKPSVGITGDVQDTTGQRYYSFYYKPDVSSPTLSNLIPHLRDDLDPLNVTVGAASQKTQFTHNVGFTYNRYRQRLKSQFHFFADYHIIHNKQLYAYAYDRTTGVRTFRPENANGQWWTTLNVSYSRPIDKMKRLTFTTNTYLQHFTNVELVDNLRSVVRTELAKGQLNLDYSIHNFKFGLRSAVTYNRASSRRADFTTLNAWDYHYGFNCNLSVLNFQLSTDLMLYSRRGYASSDMNTDDLVWNARISKHIMHGKILVMLDGFDLLHQLSNVQRYVDAQGRTETWTNVLPNYLMLHLLYHLNMQPKKK